MLWLDVDTRIRTLSKGTRSLDDFARGFFGGAKDGETVSTYDFDAIVSALEAVQPGDWGGWLRERLDGHAPVLGGIARSGWKLEYDPTPNLAIEDAGDADDVDDFRYSLGLKIARGDGIGAALLRGVALPGAAGDGLDEAGDEIDRADGVVVAVGDVEAAVGAELHVAREVEGGRERLAAVAGVAGRAGAGDAVDDAGVEVDAADAVVEAVRDVEQAAVEHERARRARRGAGLEAELGVLRLAAVAEVADLAEAGAGSGRGRTR